MGINFDVTLVTKTCKCLCPNFTQCHLLQIMFVIHTLAHTRNHFIFSLHAFTRTPVFLTGDVNSGKSTLVDRMCQISRSYPIGSRFPLSGCSLEYRFIDVEDKETDGG